MTYTITTDNAFHAGWLAAHLGLSDQVHLLPASSEEAATFKDGYTMYLETWPFHRSPAEIARAERERLAHTVMVSR